MKLDGSQLKVEYFEKNGFNRPIFVENKESLEFKIPSSNFSLNDIETLIGADYELEVIDVEKQKTFAMKMNSLKNYFNAKSRSKIYNLISLEISKTKLDEVVTVPKIVREISWVYRKEIQIIFLKHVILVVFLLKPFIMHIIRY